MFIPHVIFEKVTNVPRYGVSVLRSVGRGADLTVNFNLNKNTDLHGWDEQSHSIVGLMAGMNLIAMHSLHQQ